MRVTVFGASGKIGSLVVNLCLEKGYKVVAYVRNQNKLKLENPDLSVIVGELTDYERIEEAIKESDAVINAVGIPVSPRYDGTHAPDATKLIIKAMDACGVKRYITWSTVSVPFEKDDKTFITTVPGAMIGLVMPKAKAELVRVADAVRDSDLDWTIVRYMLLTDGAYSGKYKITYGKGSRGLFISRSDVARFMVDQLTSDKYSRSMPIITR